MSKTTKYQRLIPHEDQKGWQDFEELRGFILQNSFDMERGHRSFYFLAIYNPPIIADIDITDSNRESTLLARVTLEHVSAIPSELDEKLQGMGFSAASDLEILSNTKGYSTDIAKLGMDEGDPK